MYVRECCFVSIRANMRTIIRLRFKPKNQAEDIMGR
jgi:hypothetical protein